MAFGCRPDVDGVVCAMICPSRPQGRLDYFCGTTRPAIAVNISFTTIL